MSAIALLMGLLVLSYLGTLLVGTGKSRGLPSGVEFIGLGFAFGPHALGLISRAMITDFEPLVQVALGWVAFVLGLDFGRVEGRRVGREKAALGIGGAVFTGALVALAAYRVLKMGTVPGLDGEGALLLAAGAGAVAAETGRYAIEWVQSRWGAKGPISRLVVDIGAADDLVPLVAIGAIFATAPSAEATLSLPAWGWFSASIALGALLGVVTAMLLRGAEGDAVWGALVGTLLLGVGAAARLGLSTIFVTFVLGVALANTSPSRRALRAKVKPTERAALYPVLLLAGARLDPTPVVENHVLAALVALVFLARIAGKLLAGGFMRTVAPEARAGGPWLGVVLLSSGPVSIACGFLFALRFPGPIGDTLLLCAVASAVLGELISTFSLKGLLVEVGEIAAPAPAEPARATAVPPPPQSEPIALDLSLADEADEADGPAQ